MKNIYLIGMMGSGKTTIGQEIKNSSLFIIDTDKMITEQSGMTPQELFIRFGEEYFRDIETKILKELSKKNNLLVSCGGGIILRSENIEIMKSNGKIIYVKRNIKNILSSIDITNRPLFKNGTKKFEDIYNSRQEIYEKNADYILNNDGDIKHSLKQLIDFINNL
ncbi:MAG: shikimate kinase [Mycoplasmataceae bacterium]|jgi:shikimate kinase|nr:shikimate kinase [Mycoplasmataceae bacterium]